MDTTNKKLHEESKIRDEALDESNKRFHEESKIRDEAMDESITGINKISCNIIE